MHRSDPVVAFFDSHEQAELAIDRLAKQRFPVHRLVIESEDAYALQRVTGLLGRGRCVLLGVVLGTMTGGLIGLIAGLLLLLVPGMLVGAIVGAVCGLLFYVARQGHDFTSELSFGPGHFRLRASAELADRATRLLGEQGA